MKKKASQAYLFCYYNYKVKKKLNELVKRTNCKDVSIFLSCTFVRAFSPGNKNFYWKFIRSEYFRHKDIGLKMNIYSIAFRCVEKQTLPLYLDVKKWFNYSGIIHI